MKFSLIIVRETNNDGTINGTLLQNKIASSLDEVIEFAKQTKAVNGNKIDIAVVDEVSAGYVPPLTDMRSLYPLAVF